MAGKAGFWARLRREPLVHFVVVGAALFTVHGLTSPALGIGENPRRIHVSRADLVRFLENRARVFDEDAAMHTFDTLDREDRQALLKGYLREEALYREAVDWGLEDQDYVIRRRLVQTMEYAIGNDVQGQIAVDETEGRRWYEANRDLYAQAPTISFTHVFFRDGPQAAARARAVLARLRGGAVDPAIIGDRFLYSSTYSGQSVDAISGFFGQDMAKALFSQTVVGQWIGPLRSTHGLHLVYATRKENAAQPSFEEVRDKAMADAAEAARRKRIEAELQRVVDGYRVALANDLSDLK